MKQSLIISIVAVLALSAGIVTQRNLSTPPSASTLSEFTFPDLTGKMHSSKEWQGKILLINFWASWCPPCIKEIPEFIQLQKQLGQQNIQFIGIAIEDRDSAMSYANINNINYPILIAAEKGIALAQQLGNHINAIPFTLVVDQDGNIVHRHPGEFSKQQILEVVSPFIDSSLTDKKT